MFWQRVIAGGASSIKNSFISAESKRWYQTIQAIPRENKGHRLAIKERSQGRIPSVVLTSDYAVLPASSSSTRKQLLTTDSKQIQSLVKNDPYVCSTVYNLEILAGNGSSVVLHSGPVLPIKVHQKEETGEVMNLVMVWADEGTEMKVNVPIVFEGINDCPGIKKGGYLQILRPYLKYLCPVEHIPRKIEIDLLKMDIGDQVLTQDVKVHPSLKLLSKNDQFAVCKILATKPAEPEVDNSSPAKTETSTEA